MHPPLKACLSEHISFVPDHATKYVQSNFLVNDEFDVCGLLFRLILTRDFQFVLENRTSIDDVWGDTMFQLRSVSCHPM